MGIKMRILYITTIGSTMGFFKSFIRELICSGSIVDIAANENGDETPVPNCYREWECKIYQLPCSRSPLDKGNIAAVREIKRIIQNGGYDLVHCHTPIAAACTRAACKGLRKKGVKVLYTAHGFHFYKGAPLKNWLLYYPVEWFCAHWTDILITINREDYERARRHLHTKQVKYVPGVGVDIKRFADTKIDRAAKRSEIGVQESAVLLISVGELSRRKNHALVIRSLAKIKDNNIHYVIAGIGPLQNELQALAASLDVSDRVHFLGYRKDILELYKAADICVFPSIQEGLPVAVMEAMACGLPIIATDIRGTNDLLIDSENALIERHDDVIGFSKAIVHMCSDLKLRIRLGAENQERSRQYDVGTINQKMMQIYESIQF